uniref:hypothetical protein n=1 Tax=Aquimarina longa TaxID=1080221 RepID=UPI000B272403
NASLTEDGTNLILTDSDGSTVSIALSDIDDNTTNASLTEDGTNLILTDSDGSTVSIALSDLTTSTFYTSNGTLTSSRIVNGGNNSLVFNTINAYQLFTTTTQISSTNTIDISSIQSLRLGSTGNTTQISGALGIQLQNATHVQDNLRVDGSYSDSSGDAGVANQVLTSTGTGTNWVDVSSLETVTTITDTNGATTKKEIATYSNEAGGAAVSINETVTSLEQDNTPTTTDPTATGEITYTDENGSTSTAQVVSADANNNISVGADGGAFLSMPIIYAAGKVNADGTVNTGAIYNASINKVNTNNGGSGGGIEGDYEVNFDIPLTNINYVIQLTILDCAGDCPGNTLDKYDDPGITYYNQTVNGFSVNIKDSDNGTNQGDDIDLDFMFSVIKLPN